MNGKIWAEYHTLFFFFQKIRHFERSILMMVECVRCSLANAAVYKLMRDVEYGISHKWECSKC